VFEGFTTERIDVGDAVLHVRHGGTGTPLLLLHGHPRTGATWHRVAERFLQCGLTVVVPDLRGYGQSSKPPTTPDHAPYSKRAMADDMRNLMKILGHEAFMVVGHDRGSYVAFRLAMDYPDAVARLALLDSVPIIEALERCDEKFARLWWHWFFFARPDTPERVITADPDAWYTATSDAMGEEAFAETRAATRNPETVHAMLEDYRAGLGIDREHDRQDRERGRQISCPVLVLWSTRDDLEELYGDPLLVWRAWTTDLRGHGIESGHHMAEEAPDDLADALLSHFLPS